METTLLSSIPIIEGFETFLLCDETVANADCYIAQRSARDQNDELHIIAFIDGKTGNTYALNHVLQEGEPSPIDNDKEPVIRIQGDISGDTGQVTILQEEGHYRRYSRWDRIDTPMPNQPSATVRTLPQCGCGGYLGAPMVYDSFAEMTAYFFVVFSNAKEVNDKHMTYLTTNDSTCRVS